MVNTYFALFMYETLYADGSENAIQMIDSQLQADKQNGKMTVVDVNCKMR